QSSYTHSWIYHLHTRVDLIPAAGADVRGQHADLSDGLLSRLPVRRAVVRRELADRVPENVREPLLVLAGVGTGDHCSDRRRPGHVRERLDRRAGQTVSENRIPRVDQLERVVDQARVRGNGGP